GFDITAACELMAICCLVENIKELKDRIDNMLVAYTKDKTPIYAKSFNVSGAMVELLKEAINPNLVQTGEGNPCIVHLGPFANIAHGCNSLIATRLAMKLADYTFVEAGFGADLGAEKFLDIKCRKAGLIPDLAVIVVTVKALKYNGFSSDLSKEDLPALEKGIINLKTHINNMKKFKLPIVVCINRFVTDTD
ncbi:MAG: formate--tetrahydrofolate ligase, partial [Bacilli bacterium]